MLSAFPRAIYFLCLGRFFSSSSLLVPQSSAKLSLPLETLPKAMDDMVHVHFSSLPSLLVISNVKLLVYYSRHTCKLLESMADCPSL